MVKPRLVLIMGLSCSGKTTYASSNHFIGFEYVHPIKFKGDIDSLRSHLFTLIDLRKDIVIDDDNLTAKDRSRYLQLFREYKNYGRNYPPEYLIECHHIATPLSKIVENGVARQTMGGARLNKARLIFSRSLVEIPTISEGFHLIVRLPPDYAGEANVVNRAIFFSLPSVVFSAKGHIIPMKASDVKVYPDVNRMFGDYFRDGYLFIGIANLPMIEAKQISLAAAQECIIETIKQLHPPIEAVYYSPFLRSNSDASLPSPTFAYRAKDRFKINLEISIMVGLTKTDLQFAKNAGIGTFLHRDDFFKAKMSPIANVPDGNDVY